MHRIAMIRGGPLALPALLLSGRAQKLAGMLVAVSFCGFSTTLAADCAQPNDVSELAERIELPVPDDGVTYRGRENCFSVTTPHLEFELLGSSFRLEAVPDISVEVLPLDDGAVVRHKHDVIEVSPGGAIVVEPGGIGKRRLISITD